MEYVLQVATQMRDKNGVLVPAAHVGEDRSGDDGAPTFSLNLDAWRHVCVPGPPKHVAAWQQPGPH